MKSALVVGVDSPLGQRVAARFTTLPGVERVAGVALRARSELVQGVELQSFGSDHRELVAFLSEAEVDTVVHCGLARDRSGATTQPAEADVITTMRLGAAVGTQGLPVRAWVVASSSAVYPIASSAPLLQREDPEPEAAEATPAALLLEAEAYACDVAERLPYLNVSILRLAPLAGVPGELAWLLGRPLVPAVFGFDPPIQLLHVDDAVAALAFAAERELAGIYNVASQGTIRWSEAIRHMGRRRVPVLPLAAGPLAPLARRLGLPHVPEALLGLLRFGHAVDPGKLAWAGFEPEHDQRSCLDAIG